MTASAFSLRRSFERDDAVPEGDAAVLRICEAVCEVSIKLVISKNSQQRGPQDDAVQGEAELGDKRLEQARNSESAQLQQ